MYRTIDLDKAKGLLEESIRIKPDYEDAIKNLKAVNALLKNGNGRTAPRRD
jgi:hypothetical protein